MAKYRVFSSDMSTTDFRSLRKVQWNEVTEGDTVFTIGAVNLGEKTCYGPFKVVSTHNRILENTKTGRTFFEYPETLLFEV